MVLRASPLSKSKWNQWEVRHIQSFLPLRILQQRPAIQHVCGSPENSVQLDVQPKTYWIGIILAISCPYSRAEHIPYQNSWEISGNCQDPFQVKFVFHTVCQVLLFFSYVVDCTCSSPKKIVTFNNFWKCHNNVELSKNRLIMFLSEFVVYTFQDLKAQFISFPHLSWHLCGPAKSSAHRIWEHKSSTILFSSVQNNSTDRVRCHPWSALIIWNAKIKQYVWPPSTFPMDPTPFVFHHIPEIYHTHPAELLDSCFLPKWPGMR